MPLWSFQNNHRWPFWELFSYVFSLVVPIAPGSNPIELRGVPRRHYILPGFFAFVYSVFWNPLFPLINLLTPIPPSHSSWIVITVKRYLIFPHLHLPWRELLIPFKVISCYIVHTILILGLFICSLDSCFCQRRLRVLFVFVCLFPSAVLVQSWHFRNV